jgi:hypothetical protein
MKANRYTRRHHRIWARPLGRSCTTTGWWCSTGLRSPRAAGLRSRTHARRGWSSRAVGVVEAIGRAAPSSFGAGDEAHEPSTPPRRHWLSPLPQAERLVCRMNRRAARSLNLSWTPKNVVVEWPRVRVPGTVPFFIQLRIEAGHWSGGTDEIVWARLLGKIEAHLGKTGGAARARPSAAIVSQAMLVFSAHGHLKAHKAPGFLFYF